MDILYIVGRGSKHDNIELRMSLRSLCKYGTGIGNVIVAGYPCDWLSDAVVKLPFPDQYKRKHQNIINCIRAVVDTGALKGDFLYSSDDHFYVKPTDFSNYPYYYKSQFLRDTAIRGEKCYGYHLSLMHTRKLLESYGMPAVNYEQHANTHMHTQVFKDFPKLIEEGIALERGAVPTSLVMNAWMTTIYRPPTNRIVKRPDLKVRVANTANEIRQFIGGRECFSIGDAAFASAGLTAFFNEEFPDKCKYEV